jgi:hypothetical protein
MVLWQGCAEVYNGAQGEDYGRRWYFGKAVPSSTTVLRGSMVGNVDSWQGGVDIVMTAILLQLHCGKTSASIIVPIPTPGSSQLSSDSRSQSMNSDYLITR